MTPGAWKLTLLLVGVLLAVAGRPLGVLLVLGVLAHFVWSQRRRPKMAACAFGKNLVMAAGGMATPGTDRLTAIHEAGHVACKPPGTRVIKVEATKTYGFVRLNRWSKNVEHNIAFLLGGQYAARSTSGCGYDNSVIKAWLKTVPPDQKDAVWKAAQARARSQVNSLFSGISANAKIIQETGTL